MAIHGSCSAFDDVRQDRLSGRETRFAQPTETTGVARAHARPGAALDTDLSDLSTRDLLAALMQAARGLHSIKLRRCLKDGARHLLGLPRLFENPRISEQSVLHRIPESRHHHDLYPGLRIIYKFSQVHSIQEAPHRHVRTKTPTVLPDFLSAFKASEASPASKDVARFS